jgi:hypothetical protein
MNPLEMGPIGQFFFFFSITVLIFLAMYLAVSRNEPKD